MRSASPPDGNRFIGSNVEFEFGATAWWTTEFYLDGQITQHDSTIFTGYRWENRFRPLMREHWINPVLLRGIREHQRRRQSAARSRRTRR